MDTVTTDDYFFRASSDQGAPGDVVAVDITLHTDNLPADPVAIVIAGCYDTTKAELLGEPSYSEVFDELFYITHFWEVGDPPRPVSPEGKKGFIQSAEFEKTAAARILRNEPADFPLMTLFFRLLGNPGEEFDVDFCDDTFVYYPYYRAGDLTNCLRNEFYHAGRNELSTRHEPGKVRIIEGPVTRPDPPANPPLAKVYTGAPQPEDLRIQFEVTGAVASAGSRDVPIGLYITSSHEFSGFSAGIRFPLRHLELVEVEEHIRPGIARINNDTGSLVLMMRNSRRRVGAEGERVRIATLHFNVREAAREVEEVSVSLEPVGAFVNWIVINTDRGILDDLPVETQVEPLSIQDGLIQLVNPDFLRGDSSGDGELGMTDPLLTLHYLFLSEAPPGCLDAADANDDGVLNVTDPIASLEHLFRGGAGLPAPFPEAGADPTPDALRCSS